MKRKELANKMPSYHSDSDKIEAKSFLKKERSEKKEHKARENRLPEKSSMRSIHAVGLGHGVVKGPVGLKSYSDKK